MAATVPLDSEILIYRELHSNKASAMAWYDDDFLLTRKGEFDCLHLLLTAAKATVIHRLQRIWL